jgi:hypothetical protein
MDTDFFKSAIADAVIPANTVAEVSEIVRDAAELESEKNRILPIKDRDFLFFGTFRSSPDMVGFLLMLGQKKESEL